MMRLLSDELESGALINAARRGQIALRPQGHGRVACGPREAQAFLDEARAELQSSGARIDDQQPKFRNFVILPHDEHRADALALELGDPAALALRIEVLDELGGDLGDEGLERDVPAVFLRVDRAVYGGNPAHVARLMLPQNNRRNSG